MFRFRRRSIAVAALATLAVLLPGTFAFASTRTPAAPKPTIVLVHGAWADASSWAPVTALLQRDGYTVLSPPNPLRGLAGDAAYLAAFLKQRTTGPVVLAGHSYGGAVITNAALSDPDVKALVYVDAFVPDQGDTILGLLGGGGDPTTLFDFVSFPNGDTDLYIKSAVFRSVFAGDLSAPVAAGLAAGQRPITLAALTEPSGAPAWKSLPSWYVLGTQDNILPPAVQQTMAQRAGSHIVRTPASHLSMLSHPATVTRTILTAVRASAS
ncbi:pimeloyl-ACP methyl ester carboxylesterase [Actinoplanes tereljensis]|uniref:Alpha/beta hydrolase n=1 Tax=Paractinoplanes tereljensis TaxID=571912 RepID=A0A919NKI8_9ACTN|nr:alpha/beta hydrolase [Actinoplanes tereljensis]GIF19661.1 alpha/beta hydrolase [Actinoplanes tereljensis]